MQSGSRVCLTEEWMDKHTDKLFFDVREIERAKREREREREREKERERERERASA